MPEDEASPFDGAEPEEYWRLVGGYRHVNRRLRELVTEPDTRRLRDPHEIAIDARADDGAARPMPTAALAAWRPDPGRRRADRTPTRRSPSCARARAGAVTTSYSRIKQAHGGYRPPTEMLDEVAAPADAHVDAGDGELPGGAATGIFLHALLEELPLAVGARDAGARRLERARRRARRHRAAAAPARTRRRRARAPPCVSRTPR